MAGKILVTGATGTVGSEVARALKNKQASFVAAMREPDKVQEILGNEVQTVKFDYANPDTFEEATSGVDRVFLLGPPMNQELDKLLSPFVKYLEQKGIKRVVYLSALGAENLKDVMPFHTNMEALLKERGFKYTFLRPTFFAQNFKNYEWENILDRKITYAPAGNGKVAFVDIRDVGEVAAKILTEPGHEGKAYALTGPEALTYHDAARILSKIRNESISYPEPSDEEYTQALKSSGAPDFIAQYMIRIYGMVRHGKADQIRNDVEQILGRKPNDLETVLKRDFG